MQSRSFSETLAAALEAGTVEHYRDAALYDHEYGRRRDDVRYYRALAAETRGPILELGCGTGRLMVPLVRDGHEVVGVDAAEPMLERLRARLIRLRPEDRERAEVVRGDFRALALGRKFPLVICPFNAFMHLYTRDDVERFFATVRAHLQPRGLFVFDVMNPDLRWLSRDPTRYWARTRFRHPTSGAMMVCSTRITYDAALQICFMHNRYERADGRGRARIVRLTHRHFFPLELEALIHYNGFRLERRDGEFDGSPLEPDSEEQICRCRLR
ncbi:MAG TPA: class I SAM-dependent methyltransferase [Polyangia bacterium]|nr:class I SAM-dependent methyltransferase [Polyangia bacterium]